MRCCPLPDQSEPEPEGLSQSRDGKIEVEWAVPAQTRTRIEVFDVAGRRLGTMTDGTAVPGSHRSTWPEGGGRLANGIYFLRMDAGAQVRRARVVVIK